VDRAVAFDSLGGFEAAQPIWDYQTSCERAYDAVRRAGSRGSIVLGTRIPWPADEKGRLM